MLGENLAWYPVVTEIMRLLGHQDSHFVFLILGLMILPAARTFGTIIPPERLPSTNTLTPWQNVGVPGSKAAIFRMKPAQISGLQAR